MDKNRQHRRIEKKISLKFCIADVLPQRWDMSVIQNISAGGVRFSVPTDLKLKDKIVRLQIRIPELAPVLLEIEAVILEAKPRSNPAYSDVRAKFINLTEINKEHLSIVEKMIDLQEAKNAKITKN